MSEIGSALQKQRQGGEGSGTENLAQGIIDRGGLEQGPFLREQRPTSSDQRPADQSSMGENKRPRGGRSATTEPSNGMKVKWKMFRRQNSDRWVILYCKVGTIASMLLVTCDERKYSLSGEFHSRKGYAPAILVQPDTTGYGPLTITGMRCKLNE
jgi:hypothetical protein